MDKNDYFKKALRSSVLEPQEDFSISIWNKIKAREKRLSRIKLYSFSILSFFSLIGTIPIFETLLRDLAKSGFYEYTSIVFSDTSFVLSSWKEIGISIFESLPVLNGFYILFFLFMFSLFLRFAIRQARNQLSLTFNY